jgi:acetyl esterase/lipase
VLLSPKMTALFALFAVARTLGAQQLSEAEKWANIAAYEFKTSPNITYGRFNNTDLKLDIITPGPRSQVRPTLIFMHGGGWVWGTKEDTALHLLPFLAHGMNVVNVEYRLGSTSLAPAAVEDCRCALRWVYQNAAEYGIDTARLVAAGYSAGGHLSLMTGMLKAEAGFDNQCPGKDELKIAAIVNYYGITDVADVLDGPHMQDYAVMWMAGLPNRTELAKQLSPLTYVRPGLPPIITLHGDNDKRVPYAQAVRLHEALDRVGVPNRLVTVPGRAHGGWSREENQRAHEAVIKFLQLHGIL